MKFAKDITKIKRVTFFWDSAVVMFRKLTQSQNGDDDDHDDDDAVPKLCSQSSQNADC